MGSTLRYTEDKAALFDIDYPFQKKVKKYSEETIKQIVFQIVDNVNSFPKDNEYTQDVYGVIKGKDPLFFMIEYLNEENEIPLLVDFLEVTVDEYLDAINENKHLKQL
jgi:hypothetical protein